MDATSPDPFSDWSAMIDKPVHSSDPKKIGFLQKTLPKYLAGLSNYSIPKSLVGSVDKKGIRLRITAYETPCNPWSRAQIHDSSARRLRPAADAALQRDKELFAVIVPYITKV